MYTSLSAVKVEGENWAHITAQVFCFEVAEPQPQLVHIAGVPCN